MPQPTTRRAFFHSLALMTVTPLAIANVSLPISSIQLRQPKTKLGATVNLIDTEFVSINGWIVPLKKISQGDT